MKNYLVFDIGGTFIKYALMDDNAVILEKDKVPTPSYEKYGKEDFYRVLDSIAEKYRHQISGIAISMPGMLDSKTGYCVTGGYLTYVCATPVAEELTERLGVPVTIENDGKCAALAEYWKGSLKGYTNAAVVVLGTGIAGGIILNGQLYRGNRFSAGEYSYICVEQDQAYETNSYWGMTNGASGLSQTVAKYVGEEALCYDGIRIFKEANEGNEQVLKGLKEFTDHLAVQIYNLNILLDLDIIAVGGGISQQPLLFEYLESSLKDFLKKVPLRSISPYIPEPRITNCKFYNDANLIGALYHFMNSKKEHEKS